MFVLSGGAGFGQMSQTSVLEDFKPSIVNQPGQEYPKVSRLCVISNFSSQSQVYCSKSWIFSHYALLSVGVL